MIVYMSGVPLVGMPGGMSGGASVEGAPLFFEWGGRRLRMGSFGCASVIIDVSLIFNSSKKCIFVSVKC